MASAELKQIRETRRKLVGLELHEMEVLISRRYPPPIEALERGGIENERKRLLSELERLESRYLIRKAESWGIEVPHTHKKPDWYERDVDNSGGVELVTFSDRLNTLGKAVITRQIREARRSSMKWWADMLIPLLALAVAFLALFKDIIVEVLKNKF